MKTMKKEMMNKISSSVALLTILSGLIPMTSAKAEPYFTNEATPEELVQQFSPYMTDMLDTQSGRVVAPEDFGQYGIVVDIFRKSLKRPVLGPYNPSYYEAVTSTFAGQSSKDMAKNAKLRYANLANTEFAVVSVDGVPVKANLISGALEAEIDQVVKKDGIPVYAVQLDPVTGVATNVVTTVKSKKTTPVGNFKLTPVMMSVRATGADGVRKTQNVPYPFLTSETYDASTMFWGVWVTGGIFIHTTPHYYQLGNPASMGCIRQSSTDAMELFDLVTNKNEGRKAMIRIHRMDSLESYTRLRELVYDPLYVPAPIPAPAPGVVPAAPVAPAPGTYPVASVLAPHDMKWLVGQLNVNFQHIQRDMPKYFDLLPQGFTANPFEYEGPGHNWFDVATKSTPEVVYPMCGAFDCFKVWGDPMAMLAKKRAIVAASRQKGQDKAAADAAAAQAAAAAGLPPSVTSQ